MIEDISIETVIAVGSAIAMTIAWIISRAKTEFRVEALETRVAELEHRVETEVKVLSDRLLEVVVRLERITGALEAKDR